MRRIFALFQPKAIVVGWRNLYMGNCGTYSNKALGEAMLFWKLTCRMGSGRLQIYIKVLRVSQGFPGLQYFGANHTIVNNRFPASRTGSIFEENVHPSPSSHGGCNSDFDFSTCVDFSNKHASQVSNLIFTGYRGPIPKFESMSSESSGTCDGSTFGRVWDHSTGILILQHAKMYSTCGYS